MDSYQIADSHFKEWALASEIGKTPEQVSFLKRKALSLCVAALNIAEADGLVATVQGLPDPHEIKNLPPNELTHLVIDIQSRYFPQPRHFGAQQYIKI